MPNVDCYICMDRDSMSTASRGSCSYCSQFACGRPPRRHDHKIHGDECSFSGCGRFYCIHHLDSHPHPGSITSKLFPRLAAVAAIEVLEEVRQQTERRTDTFNLFLNSISPGARTLIKAGPALARNLVIEGEDATGARLIELAPEFFTPGVVSGLAAMATRTLQSVAASSPAATRGPSRLFMSWIAKLWQSTGFAYVLPTEMTAQRSEWLDQVGRELPGTARWSLVVNTLPPESDKSAIVKFLVDRRDGGRRRTAMTSAN